ncbi:MAG: helix-turn-helix domain-containing protein [Eubacterium sp.]|nr:helix-turn-helix domain-containing protein [Eubacterium sp.]MCI6998747.1 helix-turn-helix domain-containing protein [Eubacterium sp.]
METSKKIKMYRLQKQITQEELAEATNLSSSYISQVESGKKMMGRVGLEKVATALDVSMVDLLDDNVASKNTKKNQIMIEVSDCDEYEMNIIYDTVIHLKKALRNNRR